MWLSSRARIKANGERCCAWSMPTLVVVEGVNKVKKHQRPNPNKGTTGGIVEMEKPLQISNVAIYNPATQKADRVGFKILEGKGKVRYFKSNGELLDA